MKISLHRRTQEKVPGKNGRLNLRAFTKMFRCDLRFSQRDQGPDPRDGTGDHPGSGTSIHQPGFEGDTSTHRRVVRPMVLVLVVFSPKKQAIAAANAMLQGTDVYGDQAQQRTVMLDRLDNWFSGGWIDTILQTDPLG